MTRSAPASFLSSSPAPQKVAGPPQRGPPLGARPLAPQNALTELEGRSMGLRLPAVRSPLTTHTRLVSGTTNGSRRSVGSNSLWSRS
eukprot:1103943-Prorocentrum_minimum.AAC.1